MSSFGSTEVSTVFYPYLPASILIVHSSDPLKHWHVSFSGSTVFGDQPCNQTLLPQNGSLYGTSTFICKAVTHGTDYSTINHTVDQICIYLLKPDVLVLDQSNLPFTFSLIVPHKRAVWFSLWGTQFEQSFLTYSLRCALLLLEFLPCHFTAVHDASVFVDNTLLAICRYH